MANGRLRIGVALRRERPDPDYPAIIVAGILMFVAMALLVEFAL